MFCFRYSLFSVLINEFSRTTGWTCIVITYIYKLLWFQIRPLVDPTKYIMQNPITTFEWHEFFPRGNPFNLLLDANYKSH
jgi:hypothetical protein